jgi:hypothetical protein
VIAALVAAAALATPACAATPVQRTPLSHTGGLSALPWVAATPVRAQIFGLIFAYDARLDPPTFALWTHGREPVGGRSEKVLWLVRARNAGAVLRIRGRRVGGGTMAATFDRVADASPRPAAGAEYASILDLPHAGCWRLDVSTGSARGSVVVRAIDG